MKTSVLFLAMVLFTATGCAVERQAGPLAGNTAPGTTARGSTAAPTSTSSEYAHLLPPRTREIDLSGVDPCTVLTDTQLRELRYDLGYARPPLPDHNDIHGGPDCMFSSIGRGDIGSLVTIATTQGADFWLTLEQNEPRAITIDPDGQRPFHGVAMPHPMAAFRDSCLAVIDTGPGQSLEVDSGYPGIPREGPERFCQEAEQVATMALSTILADT